MMCTYKDLTEVVAGQGCFPIRPLLSCKNISYKDLLAILRDAPEIHTTDFIFQPTQLNFAYPYNRGKQWLREIKDILLLNSADFGQSLFPELYRFIKGFEVEIQGKIFIKTKCAIYFSLNELAEISRKILSLYIILPQKFCSQDISCKRNEDITVEIGKIQIPNYSGSGFYIHFSLQCKLSRARLPKPLEFFSVAHEIRIGGFGHNTCGRNGIFFILVQLFKYGNKLTEIPKQIEDTLQGSKNSYESYSSKFYKKYIASDFLPTYIKQESKKISKIQSNETSTSGEFIYHDKFGYGQILKHYEEKGDKRIDVLFSDTITRTLILKYANDHLKFTTNKYQNQEFNEDVHISSENPIYVNCTFNNGVFIEGNVSPIFISCSFYGFESAGIRLLDGAQGYFFNCHMSYDETWYNILILNKSHGEFHNCFIGSTTSDGVGIIDESSGIFDSCCFENFRDAGDGMPRGPIELKNNNSDKTHFSYCSFFATEEFKKECFCVRGNGEATFDNCNFFYQEDANLFDKKEPYHYEFYNCRFNHTFPYILPNMKKCSFEPNATKEDFKIGGCIIDNEEF